MLKIIKKVLGLSLYYIYGRGNKINILISVRIEEEVQFYTSWSNGEAKPKPVSTATQSITTTELKEIIDSKSNNIPIIDVRRKEEQDYFGKIPNSLLWRVDEIPESLSLSNDDFKVKYGFTKPNLDSNLVFYCRTGRRSLQAVIYLQSVGFKGCLNYGGAIAEWSKIDMTVKFYPSWEEGDPVPDPILQT